MSFFDKIYDITHTNLFKYVFHSGSDEIFIVNVSKISTFNENVLDSKWTLTSHTLRLVAASQQIRVYYRFMLRLMINQKLIWKNTSEQLTTDCMVLTHLMYGTTETKDKEQGEQRTEIHPLDC